MKLQLIRSATLRLELGPRRLLIDPYFAAKHSRPSFAGHSPNPLVDLPYAPQEIIAGVQAVIVSHLHSDHFDPAAQELLPKHLPVYCQPGDADPIRSRGFERVVPITDRVEWEGVTITRTPCEHGSGPVLEEMGEASGFLLEAPSEPVLYWAGDTIWTPAVSQIIDRERPEVIVTHSCGAVWGEEGTLIVMDAAQTVEVCRAAPWATVVATHMDSLDHATVSRVQLRHDATIQGIAEDRLLIPADGETIEI